MIDASGIISPRSLWYSWIDKRSANASSHRLHHKNLYILPTAAGWAFLALAFVVWLLGTNYQNNLILALAYFQVSVFVVAILHTYNNMAGLQVDCLGGTAGHAGQRIPFKLRLHSRNRFGCHYLRLGWRGDKIKVIDCSGSTPEHVEVDLLAQRRGRLRPPMLLLRSEFPLGLVTCWAWLNFATEVIAYPKPLKASLPKVAHDADDNQGVDHRGPGNDEFLGYRSYRPGDSMRNIAWKQYARERGLHSKVFGSLSGEVENLHWQNFFNGDTELALSQMTYCALQLGKSAHKFGLTLPHAEVARGEGDVHLAQVLRALALYREA